MAYKVILQDSALKDVKEYAARIKSDSGQVAAQRWLDGPGSLIEGLREMPCRYRVIDGQEDFPIALRQTIHFSHRVIFHVNEESNSVHVLRVYHGARKALSEKDIPHPIP